MLLRIHIDVENRCDTFLIDIPDAVYKNEKAFMKLKERVKKKISDGDYSYLPEDAVFESLEETNDYFKFVEPAYTINLVQENSKLEVQ